MTLHGDTHGMVDLIVHVRGANPDYQNGRIVELNLNLESHLVDLIRQEAVAYKLPEAIERRLVEGAARGPKAVVDSSGRGR